MVLIGEMLSNNKKDYNSVTRIKNDLFFEHLSFFFNQGKKISFTVSGNSMYPFIKNGDRVLLKPIELADIKKGRVVLACANGQFLLHRIVSVSGSSVTLAGDGNLIQHETVNFSGIWAVVVEVLNRKQNVQSTSHIFLTLAWYSIRPIRLLLFKLGSLLRIK